MSLTSTPTAEDTDALNAYVHEIEQWRAHRMEELSAPDGWLTLVGLEWLRPGPNRVGASAENDIVLSAGPAHLGVIMLSADGRTHLHLTSDADARIGDEDRLEGELFSDMQAGGHPTVVQFGTASFSLIDRDGRKGVRIRDSNAATRTHFLGLDYFPIDPGWRIEAEWMPAEARRTLPIPTTLGTVQEQPVLGKAVFICGGRQHALSAVGERADDLFFVMADATSGQETYGGARFLEPDVTSDGRMFLDFNKATNPPCAFTPYATCPLAPTENRLVFPVMAGEKMYRGAPH